MYKVYTLLLFIASLNLYSQTIQLQGKVQDSIGTSLFAVNLIATPLDASKPQIAFAITDMHGRYRINLEKNQSYKLVISSIGYSTITDTIGYAVDSEKNYVLKVNVEELQEVVIRAQLAMLVEDDKVTYRVDQFKLGTERKLEDLLKNLPGVMVDEEGNITVNGMKVTDLLVDGKKFFGGDSKLAVKYIPSDVVEEVEVQDNYHEVHFMKGLDVSNRLAMNIKLKEGKKKFVFGEVEAGAGLDKAYYLHPSLFYYSPKTSMNFIGALDNSNQSPLKSSDIARFSNNLISLFDPIPFDSKSLNQFTSSESLVNNSYEFAALNLSHEFLNKFLVDAYSIFNNQSKESLSKNTIQYITQEELHEERENNAIQKNTILLNNLSLRYFPNPSKDVTYNAILSVDTGDMKQHIYSSSQAKELFTNSIQGLKEIDFTQRLRISNRTIFEHASELTLDHTYRKSNNTTDRLFNTPIFSDYIPYLEDNGEFNFLQDNISSFNKLYLRYKHYWIVDALHHIYPVAGLYMYDQKYTTKDYQLLENGEVHSFKDAGFDNDLNYKMLNPYVGLQYKFQLAENIILRPGFTYQNYSWKIKQFNERRVKQSKWVLIPEFYFEYKTTSLERLTLNYKINSSFETASKYADRFSLLSFNQLYRGDVHLENSLSHSLSIDYKNASQWHGLLYNLSFNYSKRIKSTQKAILLEGVNQLVTNVYVKDPGYMFRFYGSFEKLWTDFRVSLRGQYLQSEIISRINTNSITYTSESVSYSVITGFTKKNYPNIQLGFRHSLHNVVSRKQSNRFSSIVPQLVIGYKASDFTFKYNHSYSYSKQKTSGLSEGFHLAETSLYYNKGNSPWGFELKVKNLFDLKYRQENTFNEFMIYNHKTFIFPRITLFTVSYKI